MRLVLFTILLAGGATASKARLKRQALPSNHVQVHSLNSNVSVADVVVVVTSSDSRIDLLEKKLNLSTWATSSNVSFDTYDTFVNYTATAAETFARIQGVELHAQAGNSEFSMTTSKAFDSAINNSLTGRVNVSIADSGMKIQALEGKWADVTASTREANNTAKSMNIYSNMSLDSSYERRLVLSAVDRLYDMEAVLLGARVRTTYGDVMIDIDPDYRTARIYTNAHTIELKTTLSPFGIEFNNERMLISAPFEETTARILKNSSDVHFIVGQLSQLRLTRGGGDIQLGGNKAQADRINVTSNSMNMDLFSTREMDARTNQSHISMMTNSTTASLTSLMHHLHVTGGVPQMGLYTGNLTINISTKPAVAIQPTLFPGFTAPADKFANVGPKGFPGDTGTNGQFSRATTAPGIDGSTGGGDVTVVTEGATSGGDGTTVPVNTDSGVTDGVTGGVTEEETDRTVGYRTPSPETTPGGEVIVTVNPVEGGNTGGDSTTEATLAVSSDWTLPPTQGELTTELPLIVSTGGGDTQASTDGQVTGGVSADSTEPSILLTTVLTIDGSTTGQPIPSDFPTPVTLPGEESSSPVVDGGVSTVTPESGASGDSTTGSSVVDQSTPEGIRTIEPDFATPNTFMPDEPTTTSHIPTPGPLPEDFSTTDYPTPGTLITAEPEALTSLEKRSVLSSVAVLCVVWRIVL